MEKLFKIYLKVFVISKIVILGLGFIFNDMDLISSVISPIDELGRAFQYGELNWSLVLPSLLPTFIFHFSWKCLLVEICCWFCGLAIE